MTQWYYSDNERNRHGPLDDAEMIERHGRGELGPDTLVWREGLPQWQPWRDLASELLADAGFSAATPDPTQLLSQRADAVVGAAVAAAHEQANAAADASDRASRADRGQTDQGRINPSSIDPGSIDPDSTEADTIRTDEIQTRQTEAVHTAPGQSEPSHSEPNQRVAGQTAAAIAGTVGVTDSASAPGSAEPFQATATSANVGDTHPLPPASSANPGDAYLAATPQAEPESPYAAPRAGVAEDTTVVLGHEVVYAGFWKRLAAYMIDSLLVTVVYYVINTVLALLGLFAFGAFSGDPIKSMTGGDSLFVIYTIVSYVLLGAISLSYYAGFESSSMQATLGKLAVGIKVVDAQGRRLSRGRAIGRWFSAILSYLTLYVGYLLIAFTDRKQGLHDMVAKTQVVDRWAYTARPELQNRTLGTVALVVLILVGLLWLLVVGALMVAIGFAAFAS